MKPREIAELIRPRPPELQREARVLGRVYDVEDLRREARRRLPEAVFDYIDGGCEEELALEANRAAYHKVVLHPRVLVDVSEVDLGTTLFGRLLPAPLGLAPTGYTRMMHPDGEVAVARAARAFGLPYALSTVGTTSIEELARVGHDRLWFQLYVFRDRAVSMELIERAAAAGYEALEVTLDTALPGLRIRDLRNGLTIPPELRLRTVLDVLSHVGYWSSMLTAAPFRFANLDNRPGTVDRISTAFDPSLAWQDLAEVRSRWPRRLVVKGPLGPEDARRAVGAGADAIHLSNHGGRQLDRCVPPLELLGPVRAAVGEQVSVLVDSGIRSGADAVVAYALGADACLVGRPYLYGLAAAGEAGVHKTITLLVEGMRRTLGLLGVTSLAELRARRDELLDSR